LNRPIGPDVDYGAAMVTVLGHKVRVDVRAGTNTQATPLLLLMGLGGNIEMWEPFRDHLARRTGATTVAFDMPGTGDSPTPQRPLSLYALSRLAVRIADVAGLTTFDVLGLSWGGLLAQQVAVSTHRRVRRVVLANTNFGIGSVPGDGEAMLALTMQWRYRTRGELAWVASAFGGEGRPAPEHTAARLARPPSRRGYLYQVLALTGWSSLPILPLLRQRVLLLNGDDDRAVPVVNSRIMSRLIPNTELAIVRGGGHLMLFERTAEVVELIALFLTRSASER
jgi:pimeloyl-ACP methyl ester carboxylesterase